MEIPPEAFDEVTEVSPELNFRIIAHLFAPPRAQATGVPAPAPVADQLELLEAKVKHPSHQGDIDEMRQKLRIVK
jgi:hypothetical protein